MKHTAHQQHGIRLCPLRRGIPSTSISVPLNHQQRVYSKEHFCVQGWTRTSMLCRSRFQTVVQCHVSHCFPSPTTQSIFYFTLEILRCSSAISFAFQEKERRINSPLRLPISPPAQNKPDFKQPVIILKNFTISNKAHHCAFGNVFHTKRNCSYPMACVYQQAP